MDRREFLKTTSAGAMACAAGAQIAHGANEADPALPRTQSAPQPDLGTHWANLFAHLSARCTPKMSFLDDAFDDPKAWSDQARSTLVTDLHQTMTRCDPNPEIVDETDLGTHVRQRIMINTQPEVRIPVYVLIPSKLSRPAPAIVALHDHGGLYFWGKEKLVNVSPEHPALTAFKDQYYAGRSLADELASRGFVVIAGDALHWGERGLYLENDPLRIRKRTMDVTPDDIRQFNARSWDHEELIGRTALACGTTWSGIMLWDDLRVTDYLLTRPEVDPNRVGCMGLSLGAVRTIFLGALHPAVRASVAVCWMAKYAMMVRNHVRNGIGYTKLVPGLYGKLDWPDLAGLHWPGSLMTINGLKDTLYPLEAAQQAVEKIRRIFAKTGTLDRYEGLFFDGPHEFNATMQDRAFEWLAKRL